MNEFRHSVRVPRLYKVAAKIAKDVKEGVGSIKQLLYENQRVHPRLKSIYSLIVTLFQKSDVIESLLKRSQFLTKEPRSDPWLIKVLIVELLWGRKLLAGESTPIKTVRAYEQIFKAHLNDVCLTADADKNSKAEIKPRYVRVNTLSASLSEAVDAFRDEGWDLCKFLDKTDYKGFLSKVTSLAENEFLVDIHVPNLLIFPPKTEFYKHPAYKNGSIVLQDKASCLPVHILGPEPGSIVLDMCAAPGMKTTQIAAAIKDEGTIYAVESDLKRFETLNQIIESLGATCVKTVNKDVLKCDGGDFPGVQYILVDPSCTGSGMTDRVKFEKESTPGRVQRLAGFQIKILRSALTRYPDAKRVVYSTCSIFPEENEDVVRQVLETNPTFKLVPAKQFVGDTWTNFGSPDFGDLGKYCLYARPDEDFTNGFFVAVFERLEEGENNVFFNTKIYNYMKHVHSQEKRRNNKQQELDEGCEKDNQHDQESIVRNGNENTNMGIDNNAVEGVKRKKKKNDNNGFIRNDEQACIESNSYVEDKKHSIKEKIVDTRNKSNQIEDVEGVNKKMTKSEAAEVNEHFINKSQIIPEKRKKKKCKKSHSEAFDNRDGDNLEPVKHKKKNKEPHTDCTRPETQSNKEIDMKRNGNEFSAMESRTKKVKKSTEPHNVEIELLEEKSNVIKKKKKKHLKNKNEVSIVNNSNELLATEICISKKRKKNKESHIGNIEPVTEHNVTLGINGNKFSAVETQVKKAKKNAEQHDSELKLIEETDSTNKKKKRKHRENKGLETTIQNNVEVRIVNDCSGFSATDIHISKKRKKNKEPHIEDREAMAENNVSLEKGGIEFSAMETQIKKPKRSAEQSKSDLEIIKESDIVIKRKKKKRENKGLETTDQNNDEVSTVNDSNELAATEIHFSKKRKKNKESHIEYTEPMAENNVSLEKSGIEFSALETQTKKAKRSAEQPESDLEIIKESDIIIKKKKKKRENKVESTDQNSDEVSIVNDSNELAATEVHISKKRKKNKELHIDSIGTVAESNVKVNVERNAVDFSTKDIQKNRRELEQIEETGTILTKKKKHRENEVKSTIQNNNYASIVNESSEFSVTEIHGSKKRKKDKESHIERTGSVVESDEKINLEKSGIEFSAMETQTKKAKKNKKHHNNESELIDETGNITINNKKKKHRKIEKLETTVEINDEVSIAHDSREFSATEIAIRKRKKHREAVNGNSNPVKRKRQNLV